jgi:hypothetical protein
MRAHVVVAFRRFYMLTACWVLASAGVACSTIGHNFDFAKVDQLVPGTSTIADATRLFGKPTTTHYPADSTKLLMWQYAQGTALGTGKGKILMVLFDRNDRMVRVVSRTETDLR